MSKQSVHVLCLFAIVVSCLFCLLFLGGCSSINFVAEGNTPFQISAGHNSDQIVEVEDSTDFYFWGESPGVAKINLEEIEAKLGMTRPSFVSVEQTISMKSLFYTFVTFGLYCPVDYKIKMLKVTEPAR